MTWDEAKHPRVPGGKVNGGQFTDKEMSTAADAATTAAGLSAFPPEFKRPSNSLLNFEGLVEAIAKRLSISPGRVRNKLNNHIELLQEIVDDSNLSIRVSEGDLKSILDEGRIKSQFETGKSKGYYSPETRREAEHSGLGYPEDLAPEKRPIYGFFDWGDSDVKQYGRIELVLNENVKDRTTVSYGDSLNGMCEKTLYPSPARKVDAGAFEWRFSSNYVWHNSYAMEGADFIEAQIHGGVSLADIREVIIHKSLWESEDKYEYRDIKKWLESAGIRWRFNDSADEYDDVL